MKACLQPQVSWSFIKMTIIRQRMKDNEEIKKYWQEYIRIVYNSLHVCVYV